MHYVQFPPRQRQADLMFVLALWHELVAEWHGEQTDPLGRAIPQGARMVSLATYLARDARPELAGKQRGLACRFDVVLRLASGILNTMHATTAFFAQPDNSEWFTAIPGNLAGGNPALPLNMVALTPAAIALWKADPAGRMTAIAQARAVLESDIESDGIIVALLPTPAAAPVRAEPAVLDRAGHVRALVHGLHTTPYQPMYRRKPSGAPVTGWDARLQAYFWPSPEHDYRATAAAIRAIEASACALAQALDHHGAWNAVQRDEAIALALEIFRWGGVPQEPDTVTAGNVERVFRAALANDGSAEALMNSGWTKVAAFASACREGDADGKPQAIWDSRVAASITARLDRQLPEDAAPASLFPGVGTVPGRGGSRPRTLSRRWPSGYRSWSGQVSGSAIVREMRDHLNAAPNAYPRMPLPGGGEGAWTTRGVEMVLFMDGY